jgi:hypothetical protein
VQGGTIKHEAKLVIGYFVVHELEDLEETHRRDIGR